MSRESKISLDSKRSWFTLGLVFLSLFGVGGLQLSFGAILSALVREFGESKSKTAWIGSLVPFFKCVLSPLTIFIAQRHGTRVTQFLGGAFLTVGVITTSLVSSINLMYLTYGTLVGIGLALVYSPVFAVIPELFDKYVSIATSIGSAGGTAGLMFFSFVLPTLLDGLGLRETMWAIAVIGPLISVCGFGFLKPTVTPDSGVKAMSKKELQPSGVTRGQSWWKSLKKKSYVLWCISFFTYGFVEYVPVFLVAICATESGIPASQTKWLNIMFGFGCFFGQLTAGCVSQNLLRRDQCKFLHLASLFTYSVASFLASLNTQFQWLAVYMVLVGFLEGIICSMFFIVTLEIVGIDDYAQASGFAMSLCAFSLTAGPPLAGAFYDYLPDVQYLLLAISATSFLAAVTMAIIPCVTPRRIYALHQGCYDYWRVYCNNPNISPRPARQTRAFTVQDTTSDFLSGHKEAISRDFAIKHVSSLAVSQMHLVGADELQVV